MARPLRSARILALFAGALATALVACSLITGLDADYKLQSAPAGEAGKDGDVEPDAPGDARTDTPTLDGGDGGDPRKFCERADVGPDDWCSDFEDGQGPTTWGWTNVLTVKGAVDVDDGIGVNNSRALRASITNPGAASGQAFLHHVIEGSPSFASFRNHEMSFSYAITKGRNLYTAVLGAQGFGTNAGQYVGASLYAAGMPDAQGFVDVSDPPGVAGGTTSPVTIGGWRRVTISITRVADSGPYSSTVWVDDAGVQGPLSFNTGTSNALTEVWIGTFFSSLGDGGVEAVIDNVLVRQSN